MKYKRIQLVSSQEDLDLLMYIWKEKYNGLISRSSIVRQLIREEVERIKRKNIIDTPSQ